MKILIAYDGTLNAKTGLRYGISKARETNGELVVLQVFDRSAFIDYDAGPGAESAARSEAARFIEEAKQIAAAEAAGVPFRAVIDEGDAVRLIDSHAERERAGIVIVPPRYRAVARPAGRLVVVVPGTLLIPVDAAGISAGHREQIQREAIATGSDIVLVGVVPVHLYSRGERSELEAVEQSTAARLAAAEQEFGRGGTRTRKMMRAGYPDVEIMKAAREVSASMVLIPLLQGGEKPSELSKTAAILLDEPERLPVPVSLLAAPAC